MGPETKTANHKDLEQGSAPPLPPTQEEHSKTNNPLSFLGRQSSIYSLTLDEFQSTICCDTGKTFGSMNMDEFLTNIWTAEEHQAAIEDDEGITSNRNDSAENNRSPVPQPGLHRQGSLTLPPPLSRKTVEEVWSEIHREQQQQQQQHHPGSTSRQQTFGEMTLEDFLVKAGVVRESIGPSSSHHHGPPPPAAPPPPSQQYGVYPSNNPIVDPNFGMGPVMSLGFSDHRSTPNGVSGGMSAYPSYPQGGTVLGESSNYAGNGKRPNGGYPPGMCFSGRVGNGAGYTPTAMGNGSPASPVSSDGMCTNPVDNTNSVAQYGMDMGGGTRGRKRIIDGPVEKVVERRQRRMIKNRESAARSRARKQAYTVELEAELNQLKEENARLKHAVAEIVK
ncbi:hypothetical protein AQUCO_07200142v1 [Aquilegia coerulea]|uniref:BZIP domain-containing protein n=1 Tax=Aquilegia coerulea TaxID=218851 RepID=A0A2G5CAI6_AQUCA|nr:hypothetical protein AQUCO_07200142v1 [Aquilegia coerulea]PIA28283.1 hypothetical protein AQUCO_07200142v1 [Aquilegia coerulea]